MLVYDIQALSKTYASHARPANQAITLQIPRGEIFGLLGDNGAGKTTLVRQMVNLARPDGGRILFQGHPVQEDPLRIPRQVGYMPQGGQLLNHLTVGEILFHTAFLRGHRRPMAHAERDRLLQLLHLESLCHQSSGRLSGGERRLLQLAIALVGSLPVLILDEPTNQLAPQRKQQVWDLLRSLHREQGTTIILVTHDAVEAEKIVQRVGILRAGQLVALGQPQELKQRLGSQLRLEIHGAPDLSLHLPELPLQQLAPGRWCVRLSRPQVGNALDLLSRFPIDDFRLMSPNLEDLYMYYYAAEDYVP